GEVRREFAAYISSPLAGIFLVIYLFMSAIFTFQLGGLYERGQADLRPFFQGQPWLDLFLVPSLSMRLWAEDRRTGTIELLLTLPFSVADLVLGKFLAAWAFACAALALTIPLWITVGWLGNPDHGAIVVGYLACALLAGTLLALGAFLSAFTKNQVIAFVLCGVAGFLLMVTGFPIVLDFVSGWLPRVAVEAIGAMSALTHFDSMMRGVLDVRDVLYFASLTMAFLFLNGVVVEWKKAE
ncbi:MAG: ABC transporter permease subunit, partial [Phycisphaerales bacterium]